MKLHFHGCLYVCGGAILEDGDGIDLVQKYDSTKRSYSMLRLLYLYCVK